MSISSAQAGTVGFRICFTGTATFNTDYQVLVGGTAVDITTNGNCTGQYGIISGTTFAGTIAVRVNSDSTVEPDETVIATLEFAGTQLTGGVLGTATHTHTIEDDDATAANPLITISGGSAVTEGTAATFTVTATPAPSTTKSVSEAVSEDESAGQDFVASSDETTHTVMVSTAGTGTLSIPTAGDSTDEPNGAVMATVDSGSGYTVGNPSFAMVTVNDDDDTLDYPSTAGATQTLHILSRSGQVEGSPRVDSGYEGGSNFDVNMFAKALTAIEYKMCFSGTADFGVDYEILKGGAPITDNCATGLRINSESSTPGGGDRIWIKVIKDAVHEGNETVVATLTVTAYPDETTNPLGSYVRGSSKTYTIRDDDDPPPSTPPVVTISGGERVNEGAPARFGMKLDRTPTAPLFVNVRVHVPWAETYWFNTVLVGSSAPLDFEVPATEDDLHFGRGHFDYCAWVVPGDGYTIGGASGNAPANSYDGNGNNCPSGATVRVTDNDLQPPPGTQDGTQGGQGDQSPDDQGGVESQTENSAPLKDHAAVIADVRRWADETHNGQPHVDRWMRVLAAFGDDNGYTAMTAAEAREMSKRFSSSRWDPVAEALAELEAEQAAAPDPEPEPDPVPVACVSPELQSDVEGYSKENHNGPDHVDRWLKVLRTFANPGDSSTIMTPEEARVMMETFSRNRWEPVYEAIKCLEEQALQDAL